jgi:starvation-inducible outer membrane lipoprotein
MEGAMKAKYLLIGLALVLLAGCVNVKFVGKDGTKVEYTRFLTNVDRIEGKVGDNKVAVGGSTVNVESLTELLKAIPK